MKIKDLIHLPCRWELEHANSIVVRDAAGEVICYITDDEHDILPSHKYIVLAKLIVRALNELNDEMEVRLT